ncbi:hypothetical protein CYMTET_48515 [Cymbomonas tetramitiformis]|uniref:Myb-like domain-containing protein n=1 Tax=Cymbomonas tetramitiformis TaxID=36881 RepID=A0AAE0BS46_9CHLO|nr:hypothetical protein CYMTET_48515 [Cymbomonas tetramitiformis]
MENGTNSTPVETDLDNGGSLRLSNSSSSAGYPSSPLSGGDVRTDDGTAVSKVEWTSAEQASLESALQRFPSDKFSPLQRFVQVANTISGKTVRDVALRVRWNKLKDNKKKRKQAEEPNGKKVKQEKTREREPRSQSIFSVGMHAPPAMPTGSLGSQAMNGVNTMPPPQMMGMGGNPGMNPQMMHPQMGGMNGPGPMNSIDPVNTMSYAASMPQLEDHGANTVGGLSDATAQVLDQNITVVNQIRQNLHACRVHENIELVTKFRDNILKVLNGMAHMPGVMSQMPPLPVKLNVELANQILPPPKT